MVSLRTELIQLHQKLFRQNQRFIAESILVQEPDFAAYERAYKRSVARYQKTSSPEEMLQASAKADIIYVGDYHTCNQSQRSFLRILRETVKEKRKPLVALELIHKKYQSVIDDYLAGKISEEQFVRKTRLKEHWIFDLWQNFKPIFDFCRYHKIPIKAIDAAPIGSDVRERDVASSRLIAEYAKNFPHRRVFVFIGDLHIAPTHLPKDTKIALKLLGIERTQLILFQNSEAIYWKLAEKGMDEKIEVVKINETSFCRMHTPPLVCQRSYMNWLEHEEGELDYADAKHQFLELVHHITSFLRLPISEAAADEVEVFTAGDLSFLDTLKRAKHFSKQELELIKQQVLSSESYYIAKAKVVYLANLSLNHAAEEASHFIKHALTGDEEPRDLIDAFYANILHEALGFFGSKIINHKRKCFHQKDFADLVKYFSTVEVPAERKFEYEAADLVLQYLKYENEGNPLRYTSIFSARRDLFLAVTHAIGYMLGDTMYYALLGKRLSRKDLRELYTDPWREEGAPYCAYWALKRKLEGVKIPKRA